MEVSLGKLLLSSLKARKPEYDLEIETSLLIFSHRPCANREATFLLGLEFPLLSDYLLNS